MKKALRLLLILALAYMGEGCASTGGYFLDRGRDAADIFTATVGPGAGVKARVGPIHAGAFIGLDAAGLRGGLLETWSTQGCDGFGVLSVEVTFAAVESFGYGQERGKDYGAHGFPLIGFVNRTQNHRSLIHPYYTQVEVAVGLVGFTRVGFNPGELLDFILGWTTIDIYNDDVETRRSGKTIEATPDDAPQR